MGESSVAMWSAEPSWAVRWWGRRGWWCGRRRQRWCGGGDVGGARRGGAVVGGTQFAQSSVSTTSRFVNRIGPMISASFRSVLTSSTR